MKEYLSNTVIAVAVVVIVALFAVFGMTTIEPGERGVMVTQGKVQPTLLTSGIVYYNKLITRVEEFQVKQTTERLKTDIQTKDMQTIGVDISVAYRVLDGGVIPIYEKYSGDVWGAIINPRVKEALKSAASHLTANQFIQERDSIKANVIASVNKSLLGLAEIDQFNMNDVEFSKMLTEAIESKQKAQEEAKASEYKLLQATNEAKAMKIKAEAMKNNPSVVELERIKKWDGKLPTVVTDRVYSKIW